MMKIVDYLTQNQEAVIKQMLTYFPKEIISNTDSVKALVARVLKSALSQIDAKQDVANVTADKVAKVLLLSSYPVDLRRPIKYPSAEVDDEGNIHRTEIVAPQITIYWDQDKTHLFACARFPEDRKGEIIGVYDL